MKTVFNRFGVFVLGAILATSLLTACGGDPSAEVSGANTEVNGPNIHADVPSSGAAKVTAISTPAGVVQRDQPPAVPTQAGANGYLVFATDANEDLFLAAFADPAAGGVPMLTVESTAQAFALIGQGRLPAGVSRAAFVQAVKNTPGYPALVNAIRAALDRGIAPADDPEFWQSLALVLSQALPNPTASASRVQAQSLARPSVSLPLPAVVADAVIGNLAIVAGAPSVYGVRVRNGLPTHFALRGATIDTDEDIGSLTSHYGRAQVPMDAMSIDSWDSPEEVDVPGNGEVWNLHVFKSQHAKKRDVVGITEDVLDLVSGSLFAKGCIGLAAETLITSNWASWGLTGSYEGILGAWRDALFQSSTWLAVGDAVGDCATALPLPERAGVVAKFIAKAPLRIPLILISAGSILSKSAHSARTWDIDKRVGVCHAHQNLEIVSCMATLLPDIPELNMQVGETQTYVVTPYTEAGIPMSIPPNARMEYVSSRPEQLSIDPITGVMTALAPTGDSEPPVQITATTRTYNLSATMSIRVVAAPPVNATLTVSMPQVTLGQSIQLAWSSNNASACTGSGDWNGPASLVGTTTFTATSTGTFAFRLQCTGNGQTASAQASVEVISPSSGGGLGDVSFYVTVDGERLTNTWTASVDLFEWSSFFYQNGNHCFGDSSRLPSNAGCSITLRLHAPTETRVLDVYSDRVYESSGTILLSIATTPSTRLGTFPGLGGIIYVPDTTDPTIPTTFTPQLNTFWAVDLSLGWLIRRGQAGEANEHILATTVCNPFNAGVVCDLPSVGIRLDPINRRVHFSDLVIVGTASRASAPNSYFGPTRISLNGWLPY